MTRLLFVVVQFQAEYSDKIVAPWVQVNVPTPTHASKVTLYTEKGRAKYSAGDNSVVWK